MENKILFKGVKSALVSCTDENGKVYEDSMRKLMDWNVEAGLNGFYICGGTGEGPVLQKETRKEIAEIAVDEAKKLGVPIINHVGAIDLKTAVELAEHAAEVGCDAVSSVPPFFFKYKEDQICDYYKAIADASGLPVLMYASPLAGTEITPKMVDHFMKKIPNLIGLKWTSPNYYTMHEIACLNGGNINVINGPDETLVLGLLMGAQGGIGSTYNIQPKVFREIYDKFTAGDVLGAREAQFKANKLLAFILSFGEGAREPVKVILEELGFKTGDVVYPSRALTGEERERLRKGLKELNYFEDYAGIR